MAFCLTKQAKDDFKRALREREIDPMKLSAMESVARRELLSKYVGQENAVQVNALFESKLLLKNQKAGYITWAKKVAGITPEVKRDLLSRIERMDTVLSPTEEQSFLQDLADTRLGFGVTEVEAKTISDMSKKMQEAKAKMKEDFTWENKQDGIDYGAARVALGRYVGALKDQATRQRFINPFNKDESFVKAMGNNTSLVIKGIANNSRAFVASFDNSLWGNQGVQVAFNPRYTKIWAKDFARSFKDIALVLVKGNKKGNEILDATRAEVYSRKNSLNGRYEMSTPETSKLAINVVEEEIPTSLPSRIPVLGRFFKASEVAYEAGAIRLRADVADKVYAMAERNKENLNDKEVVGSKNVMINSMTGRGRIGKSDKTGEFTNAAVFSVRFFKSNLDVITFGQLDKVDIKTRKERATNVVMILASTAVLLGIAKALDNDSVEFDPRSSDFGKIRKGNVRISVAPYASIITLISRILTNHTKSSTTGEVTELGSAYGVPDGMDVFWDFTSNKASPLFSAIRDLIRRKNFEGKKPTVGSTVENLIKPMNVGTVLDIAVDKASDTLLDVIGIALGYVGFNLSVYPSSNQKTKLIPLDKKMSERNLLELVTTYSSALGADPETTMNRMFTGQEIIQVNKGIVVVTREHSAKERAELKRKYGSGIKEMNLDHTIPVKLGGSDLDNNTVLVPSTHWRSYTAAENALIKAVKDEKVTLKEAKKLIVDMKKAGYGTDDYKKKRKYIMDKY